MNHLQRPKTLRTIGILGGSSNVATAEYYRRINAATNMVLGGWDIAETVTVGMNFGNIEYFLRRELWMELERYIEPKLECLVAGKAEVIICVSNTLHRIVEPLAHRLTVQFIHIVDPTGAAMKARKITRAALFGTKPTMKLDFIRRRYAENYDIHVVVPNEEEQDFIDHVIFDELVKGECRAKSKDQFMRISDDMVSQRGVEALILGCTEISLLVNQNDRPALPIFDTTALHCQAAVDFALSGLRLPLR